MESRNVVRHVMLLNLAGRGYCVYAGTPGGEFLEQPLWVETALVSRDVIATKRQVHDALLAQGLPVSLAFRHERADEPVVLAYGCRFATLRDDKGREGLVFLHALEFSDARSLGPAVDAVLQRLSVDVLRRMSDRIARLATTPEDPGVVLKTVSARVEDIVRELLVEAPEVCLRPGDIGAIEHDCMDGASVAWLTFAYAMSASAPPWSVRDVVEDGLVRTVRDPGGAQRVRASALRRAGLRPYLDGLQELSTERVSAPKFEPRPRSADPAGAARSVTSSPAPPPKRGTAATNELSRWVLIGILAGAISLVIWILVSQRAPEPTDTPPRAPSPSVDASLPARPSPPVARTLTDRDASPEDASPMDVSTRADDALDGAPARDRSPVQPPSHSTPRFGAATPVPLVEPPARER